MNWKLCGKVHVLMCFKKRTKFSNGYERDSVREKRFNGLQRWRISENALVNSKKKKNWSWFGSSFYMLKIGSSHLHPHTQPLQSCWTLWLYGPYPTRLLCQWSSPGKNTGMCCQALLLEIFPTQGSNPHVLLLLSSHSVMSNSLRPHGRSSVSVIPMNIQDWFPLGLTGLISLQSKGLSRIFSSTKVQKHQVSDTQASLWSNSHIHTWPLEKP